jgi:LmbE family N-acetylglucosaminyl deacetylase
MLKCFCAAMFATVFATAANIVAVTDGTNYNAGSTVSLRLEGAGSGDLTASIRYAGEDRPVATGLRTHGGAFGPLWTIPWDARTGRYEVDLAGLRNATSFAVHRKLARIARIEMERTFYTNGDPINCRVTVRNLSNTPLTGLRVEFAPFHYPWIAQAPDEPPVKGAIVGRDISLRPGESRELEGKAVAIARGGEKPAVTGYAVVIWDSARKQIFDLAFTEPIFLRPPNTEYPKRYPFLYLYPSLDDVAKRAMVYRQFYPPQYVSDAIEFDTSHTIFPSGSRPVIRFAVHPRKGASWAGAKVRATVMDTHGGVVGTEDAGTIENPTTPLTMTALPDGLYTVEIAVLARDGAVVASNRLELGLNPLPKSILVFGAHQDDDTAHPALIRAAVENNVPIHFVYFTSGDAGGCDRYYQQTCDASRAMDFGETRMAETRASLGHLGVAPENVSFLGLPDGGLEEIWLHHVAADRPYLSVLLASDHAPYKEIVHPNLPFARQPIVEVAKEFIRRFKPDVIVTGHPEERHVDHRTNNWLVVKAMQELLAEKSIDPKTRLLVDQSYGETSWIHSPYRYSKFDLFVPGEVARRGQEALWFYQTQDGNHQQGDLIPYDKLKRTEAYPHQWILDWQDHAGWNERDLAAAAASH